MEGEVRRKLINMGFPLQKLIDFWERSRRRIQAIESKILK